MSDWRHSGPKEGKGYLGRDLQVLDELAVGEEGAEGEPVLNLVDGVTE